MINKEKETFQAQRKTRYITNRFCQEDKSEKDEKLHIIQGSKFWRDLEGEGAGAGTSEEAAGVDV
jgi:hypothetical protein